MYAYIVCVCVCMCMCVRVQRVEFNVCLLQKLYHVAGVEGKPVVFLLTDTQISKESFLEDVNNLLNSGEVPGMYAAEDKERVIGSIREWLLTQGAPTSKVPALSSPLAKLQPPSLLLSASDYCGCPEASVMFALSTLAVTPAEVTRPGQLVVSSCSTVQRAALQTACI